MKLANIRKGLYTDGEYLYSKMYGRIIVFTPPEEENGLFLKCGVNVSFVSFDDIAEKEVKKAKVGQSFFDGKLEVIEKDVVRYLAIYPVNPVYDKKGYCLSHDGYTEEWEIMRY